MRHLVMEPEAFRLERQVVQEERRRRVEDQPIAFLWEQLRAVAYQAHPYGWPVIGWPTDLQKLTVEEAQRFYDRYYVPNNAFLVVVGKFEDDVILNMIRRYFGPIPPGRPPPTVEAQEPEQPGSRRIVVQRPAHLPYFAVAYHVPTCGHDDAPALDIMADILGGSQSARLIQTLQRDKQLVLSTGAGYDGTSIDPSLLTLSAQPAPDVPVAAVEAAVWEVVDGLKQQALAPAELERVTRRFWSPYLYRTRQSGIRLGRR
jgi:zinc protease